jgi:hypothetical protein
VGGQNGPKPRPLRERALTNRRIRMPDGVAPFPHAPASPAGPVRDWRPTPSQLAALQPDGRALLERHLERYVCTLAEGERLLQAAAAADEASYWRRQVRELKDDPANAARAARLQLVFTREVHHVLQSLRVEP